MAMNMKCRLASFPKFAALPTEVRLLIWQHALPAPRIIYIPESTMDDADDLGIKEEDCLLSGLFVPSRLYSAQDFGLERSCVEARELVASRCKPIACAPTGPLQRIWNGFAYTYYDFAHVETESPIAWPETIRVDLSRDILYLGLECTPWFQDIFKVPGLDWPQILNETRRLAIVGEAFITLRPTKEKNSTSGNSMVNSFDREYEIFDNVEVSTLQAAELLEGFKNVKEVILSLCGSCDVTSTVEGSSAIIAVLNKESKKNTSLQTGSGRTDKEDKRGQYMVLEEPRMGYLFNKIDPDRNAQWEDWGLTPCPLSSLPTSGPAIDPAERLHAHRSLVYWDSDNRFVDRRIQLRAFRLRRIIQAFEDEKRRGRLEKVNKFRAAQVVSMVTARDSWTSGWYHHYGPTGQRFHRSSKAADQDINFL